MKSLGFVHLYFGNGKGKTTAALGLALRSSGYNFKIALVQYLKAAKEYGEINFIKKNMRKNIEVFRFGKKCIVHSAKVQNCYVCFSKFKELPCHFNLKNPDNENLQQVKNAWEKSKYLIKSKKYKIVILDEILFCINYNLLKINEIYDFLQNKTTGEIILTGRGNKNKLKKLFLIADYITEMKEEKHPYKKGLIARKGIEY